MDFKKNKKLESFNFYKNNLSIPGSPLFNVLKRFGRDELIALFFSIFSTVVVSLFTKNVLLLSLAAPILEKIGFFPGNFYDTYKDYKKTMLLINLRTQVLILNLLLKIVLKV
jgi:hypothetical protein